MILIRLDLLDACGEIFMRSEDFSKFDERANNQDAHLDGPATFKYSGKHCHPMFGECVWQVSSATPT